MNRKKLLSHQSKMLYSAIDALSEMSLTPDRPADLSKIPVGALVILRDSCNVQIMFSGDNAFGIMGGDNAV